MRVDNIRRLIYRTEHYQDQKRGRLHAATTDPTWGYYVFVTAYSETAQSKLEAAVEALVLIMLRSLRSETAAPYADEASKRLKLDVILDKEALENASEDRVREEFRAQLRGLGLSDDEFMTRGIGSSRVSACILFDEDVIETLSKASFPDDPKRDLSAFANVLVRIVDPKWTYPAPPTWGPGPHCRASNDWPVANLVFLYARRSGDLMFQHNHEEEDSE
ncbi:hypothetical protein FALBO_12740 [Fusarium albosuccineum]|uniref:Uncharacterized protein n=1 Tax=Fusarium albosuccineum TaxID=1237068 RepID=A0A8H4L044_9HYPO|nr:hypothetical protein FALBO_12740 [Fusarium albosuccineum]